MGIIKQLPQHMATARKLATLYRSDKAALDLLRQVQRDKLTYLGAGALVDLHNRVKDMEQRGIDGILVEAGCALGGSALVMTAAKSQKRPFYIYDAFGMIPPPSPQDGADVHARYQLILSGQAEGINGETYYGYQTNLLDSVRENFERYGLSPKPNSVHFVKGLYEETLHITQSVALAHIDCDWHDSVMVCLAQIVPHLSKGGVLIIDDYADWSGCRTAVDTFFSTRQNEFEFVMLSRLHIIRR